MYVINLFILPHIDPTGSMAAADWKVLEKMKWRSERRISIWLQRPNQRLTECVQMRGEVVLLQEGLGRCRNQRYAIIIEFNIFYYQLVFAEVTIVVPNSPRPGEASGGSDCGCTPSTPAFEPAGA